MVSQEAVLELSGMELYYRLVGKGRPLLLLHGFLMSGAQWEPFLEELAGGFRLIIPDQRGHGWSTNPAGVYTHRQAAADAFALLDALGIGRYRAMGFSGGAMTLLHMATQQPERIERMVLFSPTTHIPDETRPVIEAMTYETAESEFLEMIRGFHPGGEAQIRTLFGQFRGFAQDHEDMNFTAAELATITARTLIVHGDRDEFFPVSIPVAMYHAIPDAALWIVPGGGHADLLQAIGNCAAAADRFPKYALTLLRDG